MRVVFRESEGSCVATKGLTEVDKHVMASRDSTSAVKDARMEMVWIRSKLMATRAPGGHVIGRGQTKSVAQSKLHISARKREILL